MSWSRFRSRWHSGRRSTTRFHSPLSIMAASDVVLLLGRARLCLAQRDGLRPALALLQTLAVEKLDDESLSLRAELAEKAGEIVDAVLCLQHLRMRATDDNRPALTKRLCEVVSQPKAAKDVAITVLEKLQI